MQPRKRVKQDWPLDGAARTQQRPQDGPGEEELEPRRQTPFPVPTPNPMAREELSPARPRERHDVLEIGSRGRESSDRGGIEQPSSDRKRENAGDARDDFEALRGDVLVWDPVRD
jgi:hypothetical protein